MSNWIDDLYLDFDELYESLEEQEEDEIYHISDISDEDLQLLIDKMAKNIIKQTINYVFSEFAKLKRKGIIIEPEVKYENDQVIITYTIKGVSKKTYDQLSEIAYRLRLLQGIRKKPRGIHAKKSK